jgi:endonuclease/exonuclease/phosphatase family metal-dependent hydrolase
LLGVWLLNVSRAGTRVQGCPQGCASTGERRDGPLRILSLNVLHGFPRFENLRRRLDLIAGEIRRLDADIVCLQEVPWTVTVGSGAGYLARRTGLNHLYLRANGNRWAILFEEGEALLSRYPLRDASFMELRPRAGFFEHRVVLRATALTPRGEVPVFVTHLTDGEAELNRAQADSLLSYVSANASGPALVAGDLNATEHSPQIEALTAAWLDTYRSASPHDPGFTCCIDELKGGPSQPLKKRIDYLFLVPGDDARIASSRKVLAQPVPGEQGWLWASDHVGLLTAIELKP